MAIKKFIQIDDADAPEVKAGKEQLNVAFNSLDEATQKSLGELQKANADANEAILQKSITLEKSLGEMKTQFEKDGKDATEQIEALKTALTELNKAKIVQESAKRKTMSDSIQEAMEGKGDDIKSFLQNKSGGHKIELKAAPANMTVITGAVAPDYQPIVGPAHEWVHARQFIPVSPTVSNLIRYVKFTKTANVITAGIAQNGLKPQIDYVESIVDAPVIKIAGWINVADEFLEDIVGATSFLSAEMPMALYDAEDQQVFKGDGTTNNLPGLYTNATQLAMPYAGVPATANNIDLLLAASTYVRRQKRVATAAWTSPEDYLDILINKSTGATAVYTYPVVFNATTGLLTLGDLPVLQHTVFNPGEGFVGDFARGCRIFQKADATMRFSTENVDNFVKNVTTVLVEERIALADFYPESFVKVSLAPYNS